VLGITWKGKFRNDFSKESVTLELAKLHFNCAENIRLSAACSKSKASGVLGTGGIVLIKIDITWKIKMYGEAPWKLKRAKLHFHFLYTG
jgi:hypothetical protein